MKWQTLWLLPVLALCTVSAANAQTPGDRPQPPAGPGPLVVEKIEQGWLFVPDAKAADIDGRVGALVGGYAGHITDRTWLIGGGGYWLTNRDDDFKLAYGGLVVEWMAHTDRRVGFGLRTLIGAGSGTLGEDVTFRVGRDTHGTIARSNTHDGVTRTGRLLVRDDFFIAEPQANVLFSVTRRYRFSVGVGYRAIGFAPALGDQLSGISGSISFQIGGGS